MADIGQIAFAFRSVDYRLKQLKFLRDLPSAKRRCLDQPPFCIPAAIAHSAIHFFLIFSTRTLVSPAFKFRHIGVRRQPFRICAVEMSLSLINLIAVLAIDDFEVGHDGTAKFRNADRTFRTIQTVIGSLSGLPIR